MVDLFLATVLTGAFGIIVRFGQKRHGDLRTVGMVNYLVASLTFVPLLLHRPPPAVSAATLHAGLLGGLIYASAYFLIVPVLASRGVAIATAVTRLSVLIPMLLALLLWRETPTLVQGAGALLALLSLPLLAIGRIEGASGQPRGRDLLTLIALFFVNGACLAVAKWYHVRGNAAERPVYFMLLFGVAALYLTTVWLLRSRRVERGDVLVGAVLGVSNAFANFTLLLALDHFPGVVVFPVTAAGGLVFAVAFAAAWWRELPSKWGAAGVALAVLAVVLVNV